MAGRHLILALLVLFVSAPLHAVEFSSLFKTDAQRAAAALEEQDWDSLQKVAPNSHWQGVADYGQKDYANALSKFEQLLADPDAPIQQRRDAAYNAATTLVQLGDYQGAIDLYDALLEEFPEHANAQHNRDIAQQLLAAQQQSEQSAQGDNQQGDAGDDQSEQNGESNDASAENQSSDEGSANNESSASDPPSDGQTNQQDSTDSESNDPEGSDEDAAAAAAALAGDDSTEEERDQEESDQEESESSESPEPMSEQEQATEQWLRRIPDDPAGLLRNKLERSHYRQYPEVQGGADDW